VLVTCFIMFLWLLQSTRDETWWNMKHDETYTMKRETFLRLSDRPHHKILQIGNKFEGRRLWPLPIVATACPPISSRPPSLCPLSGQWLAELQEIPNPERIGMLYNRRKFRSQTSDNMINMDRWKRQRWEESETRKEEERRWKKIGDEKE
jgi:hypothetical protein